ncbi:MAG: hypothetical protein ABEJ72_00440, partial [Candidatus Aenigmatarchaeota archaeon]
MKDRRDIGYGLISFVLVLSGFLIIKLMSLSSKDVLLFSIDFADIFIDVATNSNFVQSILSVIPKVLVFALPFIPLTLAFAVLASYGMNEGENKRLALTAVTSASIIGLLITGFTLTGLFFFVG